MRPGELVADRFEIEALVGAGGMGSIYRARDRLTGERIALKTMRGTRYSPRFVREARVLAELSHPAVVRYVAHGPLASGEPFLAMEWLDGEDLSDRLCRAELSPGESVVMAARVAEALGAAHAARIVHRDVKPGNIFLPDGDVAKAKLLDFGIAHMIDATRIATQKGAIVGTPGYMAPEQARGVGGVDARADVFSLGCVLYRCLAGRPPFEGDDLIAVLAKLVLDTPERLRALGIEIPAALDDLVAQMLAKRADDRPASGAAVARALAQIEIRIETRSNLFGIAEPLSESLTGAEQRLVSVVVVAPEERAQGAATGRGVPTAVGAERHAALVETFGAQVVPLADGSMVATLRGDGEPTDQAAQAARYALALRAALPSRSMALATSHHVLGDRIPLGEIVDRAAAMLGRTLSPEGEPPRADLPVRLDEVTAGLLSHRFEIGGDSVSLFLLRERAPFEATPRTLLGAPISLVGRERELASLSSIYDDCVAEPEACAVVVTAAAGVGKSRLGSEFLRRVADRVEPVEIWIARGDPLGVGAPFRMLGQAIRWSARILDGEPLPVRQKKLRARLARHLYGEELARVAEFLGELSGTPFPDAGRVGLQAARQDPVQMGDEMRRAWEDFVAAECSTGPVVLVLEDLHWGDLPSVQLIDAALRNLPDRPLLVLALCRPEVGDLFPSLWAERRKHEIRLLELSRRASERMVQEALGPAAHPEVVSRIVARAAGNAFYLEELIRAVAEGRGDQLPETVLAMVEARLAALPSDARRVLRAASVFGQVFWKGGVTALLGEGPAHATESRSRHDATRAFGATEWFQELSRREVFSRQAGGKFPGEEEYVFRHALVRDAAYAMLTESDRRLGHRLSAAWLERAGEADAAVLAEHLERAGEPARAVGLYLRAAEQALEGNDFAAALRRAKRGVACGAEGEVKGELFLVQAEANKSIGRNAEVEACAEEAMQLLPRKSARWFSAVADVAFATSKVGNAARLYELAQDLLRIDGRGAPGTYPIAAARLAMHLFLIGQGELGDRLLAVAEATDAQAPDPMRVGFVARARGIRRVLAGDLPGFLAFMRQAAEGFERAGALRSVIVAQGNIGYAYLELGAFAEAEAALRDALVKAERMGLSEPSAGVRQNLALAIARRGDLGEARAVVTAALSGAIAHSSRRLEGFCRIYLARILLLGADAAGAEREARAAAAMPMLSPSLRGYALGVVGRALLAQRRAAEALSVSGEAVALFRSLSDIEEGEAVVDVAYAEALLATGGVKAAQEALAAARGRLLARADKIGDPAWRQSFLERVPDNARVLELCRAYLAVRPS